jgi:hypothetical protein
MKFKIGDRVVLKPGGAACLPAYMRAAGITDGREGVVREYLGNSQVYRVDFNGIAPGRPRGWAKPRCLELAVKKDKTERPPVNLYEAWNPDDLPPDLREAINAVKKTGTRHRWLKLYCASDDDWVPTGSDLLTSTKRYRFAEGVALPESLRPWVKQAQQAPSKPRRFRTLVDRFLCTELPKGSIFELRPGDGRMYCAPEWGSYNWQCFDPDGYPGSSEEVFDDPAPPANPTPADRLRAGEPVDVTRISDTEFDELERVWDACDPVLRKYGHGNGLIAGNSSPLRRMRTYCVDTNQNWTARIPADPSAKALPQTETETETETELTEDQIQYKIQPQNQKETTMTPIKIDSITRVNGADIKNYRAVDRSELLNSHEQEIKRLEALEFKTNETKDEIAALRAGVVAAVKAFDEEYAARKAATQTAS